MSGVVAVGVLVVAAAVVVAVAAGLRRSSAAPAGGSTDGPGARRSLPKHVTLDDLLLRPPPAGRALVVLFSTQDCSACLPAKRRLARLPEADVVEVDLTGRADVAAELGIDGVPAMLVYGGDGALVRSWIGEPLAGTLEKAVRQAAAGS